MAPPLIYVPPAPVVPPQTGNIIHHYDFSDITTMWQDTGATSAIAEGADIARIDDLGSGADNPIQSTASQRPIFQGALFGGRGGATFNSANSEVLNVTDAADPGSNLTILIIWAPESNANTNTPFSWDGSPSQQAQKGTDDTIDASMSSNGLPSVGTITNNETTAVILTDSGSSSQEARFSIESAAATNGGASFGPDAGATISCGSTAGSLFFHDGGLAEIICWVTSLTSGERDEAEVYATNKWGVIWA